MGSLLQRILTRRKNNKSACRLLLEYSDIPLFESAITADSKIKTLWIHIARPRASVGVEEENKKHSRGASERKAIIGSASSSLPPWHSANTLFGRFLRLWKYQKGVRQRSSVCLRVLALNRMKVQPVLVLSETVAQGKSLAALTLRLFPGRGKGCFKMSLVFFLFYTYE